MNIEKINRNLQKAINKEVSLKKAMKEANLTYKEKQVNARIKIQELQELKEMQKIEDDYLLDFEV